MLSSVGTMKSNSLYLPSTETFGNEMLYFWSELISFAHSKLARIKAHTPRRTLSVFWRFKTRRTTFPKHTKFVD